MQNTNQQPTISTGLKHNQTAAREEGGDAGTKGTGSAGVAASKGADDKTIRVSDEDRARIAVLQQTIQYLEEQMASILGSQAGFKEPKLAPLEEQDRDANAAICLRVVDHETGDNQAEAGRCYAMIYVDPPGVCIAVCH